MNHDYQKSHTKCHSLLTSILGSPRLLQKLLVPTWASCLECLQAILQAVDKGITATQMCSSSAAVYYNNTLFNDYELRFD